MVHHIRPFGFFKHVKRKVMKFGNVTSLHGFPHVNNSRSVIEKTFWIVVLIHVLVICGFQLLSLIQNFNNSNIIIVPGVSKLNIWEIPFPALTICSEYQLNKKHLDMLEKNDSNSKYIRAVKNYAGFYCGEDMAKNIEDNELDEDSLRHIFKHMSLLCNDTIALVDWSTDLMYKYPCQYFQKIISRAGVCYTLNAVPFDQTLHPNHAAVGRYFHAKRGQQIQWTPEKGFKTFEPSTPPWRVVGTGWSNSVLLIVNMKPNMFDNMCPVSGYGMTIELHSPVDYPKHLTPIRIAKNDYIKIIVSPRTTTATDNLESWSPKTRGCYYDDEKWLKYYQIYTSRNCEAECKTNQTLEFCACALFYAPRAANESVCGIGKHACLSQIGKSGYRKSVPQKMLDYYDSNCHCLPSCIRMNYDHKVYRIQRNLSDIHSVVPIIEDRFRNVSIAIIELFYKRDYVHEWNRRAMLLLPEVFAKIGGIMSLFIGFSIISLFEILYSFCSVLCLKILRVFTHFEISRRSNRVATIFK